MGHWYNSFLIRHLAAIKFQIPSSKFQGNKINNGKREKRKENQDLFCLQLEFYYSLEFGFWNLEFLDCGLCPR